MTELITVWQRELQAWELGADQLYQTSEGLLWKKPVHCPRPIEKLPGAEMQLGPDETLSTCHAMRMWPRGEGVCVGLVNLPHLTTDLVVFLYKKATISAFEEHIIAERDRAPFVCIFKNFPLRPLLWRVGRQVPDIRDATNHVRVRVDRLRSHLRGSRRLLGMDATRVPSETRQCHHWPAEERGAACIPPAKVKPENCQRKTDVNRRPKYRHEPSAARYWWLCRLPELSQLHPGCCRETSRKP